MKLTKTYQTKLSVQTIFEAWISAEMVVPPITKIEVAPEVGGHFILHAQSNTGSLAMRGKFLEIEPNKKLKYTWNWEGSEETTIITVDFITGVEVSTIQITQADFLEQDSMERHATGWDYYFEALEKKLQELDED